VLQEAQGRVAVLEKEKETLYTQNDFLSDRTAELTLELEDIKSR